MSTLYFENINLQLPRIIQDTDYTSLFVLCDENTLKFCYPLMQQCLPPHNVIQIKSGEQHKNMETTLYLCEQLEMQHADRNSLLLNLGGGVISDIGGFCASVYKRGIRFVNIPTTLLSQVDASVGGKNGINYKSTKNLLGNFTPAEHVFIDTSFLKTISERHINNGIVEMLKHGIIYHANHFDKINKMTLPEIPAIELIMESIGIKEQIVNADFKENGERKKLNFGHSIGHAVESVFLLNGLDLLHGEAIAIGIICESHISFQKKLIGEEVLTEITNACLRLCPKKDLDNLSLPLLFTQLQSDKKNKSGLIYFVLIKAIGEAVIHQPVSEVEVLNAINFYQSL